MKLIKKLKEMVMGKSKEGLPITNIRTTTHCTYPDVQMGQNEMYMNVHRQLNTRS